MASPTWARIVMTCAVLLVTCYLVARELGLVVAAVVCAGYIGWEVIRSAGSRRWRRSRGPLASPSWYRPS